MLIVVLIAFRISGSSFCLLMFSSLLPLSHPHVFRFQMQIMSSCGPRPNNCSCHRVQWVLIVKECKKMHLMCQILQPKHYITRWYGGAIVSSKPICTESSQIYGTSCPTAQSRSKIGSIGRGWLNRAANLWAEQLCRKTGTSDTGGRPLTRGHTWLFLRL